MVRESNSPGTSAPTVLAGLRLYRTAHHPCQCFQYGAHRPNLDKPLMGTIFMRGSRSREDSNLRCFLVADLQSAAVAAGPRHRCIASVVRHGAMRTVPDSSVPADRESAQAHGRWIRVVELPRIELGSGLLSAFACCHVRRGLSPLAWGKIIRGRVRSANPHGL